MGGAEAMDIDVHQFLTSQKNSLPNDLAQELDLFADLYDKKLWHQLTQKLEAFYLTKPAAGGALLPVFQNFVNTFQKKLNPLRYVNIGVAAATQFKGAKAHDEAVAFLEDLAEKVKDHKDAYVRARMESARYRLIAGDMESTKKAIDECEKILDSLHVESNINASYYLVSADYYKAKADYAQFYKNALLYLACVNVEDLSAEDRVVRAHDLSIAALIGDTIYNFGELLMHPILDSLKDTPKAYLRELLFAFNAGDITRFEGIVARLDRQSVLNVNIGFLRQKICLMALIETVFKRNADDRVLTFATIATETRLPGDEVEHLVMKALSLGLIKGAIDEVEQKVEVKWVQPRVLDKTQISNLAQQISDWATKVQSTVDFVGSETPELFAQ